MLSCLISAWDGKVRDRRSLQACTETLNSSSRGRRLDTTTRQLKESSMSFFKARMSLCTCSGDNVSMSFVPTCKITIRGATSFSATVLPQLTVPQEKTSTVSFGNSFRKSMCRRLESINMAILEGRGAWL